MSGLARVLDGMDGAGVDVLLLGREGNIRFVSEARRLTLAGARAFAPGCVVVRATGAVHLLSLSDDGVPPAIPPEHLFPISWNPLNIVNAVAAIDGVGAAARIGVDGMTPLFAQLLAAVLPSAELVDGEAVLRAARRIKTPDGVEHIRRAVAVAETALGAVVEALRPGIAERALVGVFQERMAHEGITTPALDGTFCVVPADGEPRRLPGDRVLEEGDLVALDAGVLVDGWEGGLGRTWPCGDGAPYGAPLLQRRWRAAVDAVIDRCRAGATMPDLLAAWDATGEPRPTAAIVHGMGLGFERPVAGGPLDDGDPQPLEPGMVLAVQGRVTGEGVGAYVGREQVLVGEDGPEVLTSFADGP